MLSFKMYKNSESKQHIFHILLIYEGITSLVKHKSDLENENKDRKLIKNIKKGICEQ